MTDYTRRWFGWWAEEYDASLPSFKDYSTGGYTLAKKKSVCELLGRGYRRRQTNSFSNCSLHGRSCLYLQDDDLRLDITTNGHWVWRSDVIHLVRPQVAVMCFTIRFVRRHLSKSLSEKWQKGKDMRDGEYVDGKKEGRWVSYYANGSKMSEGSYRLGLKEGRWLQYWPNGSTKSEATFSGGKYTGYYVCWHDNGIKQWEGYYNPIRGNSADGTKEGVWLAYDKETGAVSRRFTYRRGSRTRPDEFPPFDDLPRIGPDPADSQDSHG